MAKQVSKITVSTMTNGAHYHFMLSTLERAKADETVAAKLSGDVTALEKALTVENDNLKLSQKSRLTAQISDADSQRDAFYWGYRNAVAAFLSLPDGALKNAAINLDEHLETYKLNTREQLDKQTGMMINFLEDLNAGLKDDVSTLGLTQIVEHMTTANDTVHTLLVERDTEKSAKIVGATKAARLDTDKAYRALIQKVNALAVIEGDTAYAAFIDGMNSQIVRFKREALNQSVSSTTTTDTTTDTTTEDDAPVVDGGVSEDDVPEVM